MPPCVNAAKPGVPVVVTLAWIAAHYRLKPAEVRFLLMAQRLADEAGGEEGGVPPPTYYVPPGYYAPPGYYYVPSAVPAVSH